MIYAVTLIVRAFESWIIRILSFMLDNTGSSISLDRDEGNESSKFVSDALYNLDSERGVGSIGGGEWQLLFT